MIDGVAISIAEDRRRLRSGASRRFARLAVVAAVLVPVVLSGSERYGIVTQILGEAHGEQVSALGAGIVRLDFNWFEIEPARGRFEWDAIDARVERARSRKLRIFATLAYTPGWAGPARNRLPRDVRDWGRFVLACMRRYGGDVVYGIWNEPNADKYLEDNDAGRNYRRLWEEAHRARLAVDPRFSLGGPETSHHGIDRYFPRVVDHLHRHDLLLAHDKLTVHWYPDGPPLGEYMDQVLARAESREVWLTETGMATCDDDEQVRHVNHVLEQFLRSEGTHWTKVFLYVLHNGRPCSEALVNPDWSPRAAFQHFRNFIDVHP